LNENAYYSIISKKHGREDKMSKEKRTKMNECYSCKHRKKTPGNAHIQCAKPDPEMGGNAYGIRSGWFMYPLCFDPVWKEKDCSNYEEMSK